MVGEHLKAFPQKLLLLKISLTKTVIYEVVAVRVHNGFKSTLIQYIYETNHPYPLR